MPPILNVFGPAAPGGPGDSRGEPEREAAAGRRAGVSASLDGRLHYRNDLIDKLKSTGAGSPVQEAASEGEAGDADLVVAAYETWGTECTSRLEGDFAFAIWDEERGEGFAAADFAAGRTLYYAPFDGSLALGSSLEAVAARRAVDRTLNLAHVGEIAAGMWAGSDETCYSGVRRLMPGHSLHWTRRGDLRTWRHWHVPSRRRSSRTSFEDAAEKLRELLVRATGERMSAEGRTAVWMSGGWDSTAVFAAGQEWLRRNGITDRDRLLPVSMSYPEGDPGREDDLIEEVASRWDVEPRWVASEDVPVLDHPAEGARHRDDPWAHPLEHWNRALAAAAHETGADAVLTGNGGDQLFAGPVGQFSDLFWTGRWVTLRREWVERQGKGVRTFLRAAVLPGAPRFAYELARLLRGGKRLPHYLDRRPPPWIRDSFVREARLMERQWDERSWWRPGRAAQGEIAFYFDTAYAARVSAAIRGFALDESLELASPLLDRRVVEFAAARPTGERSKGLESKLLLREAMRGLLPDSVLAPRARKTGLTVSFFDRGLRAGLGSAVEELAAHMMLEKLGIVDAEAFRGAAAGYLKSRGASPAGLGLYLTLHAELWLRAHLEDSSRPRGTERAMDGRPVV